MINSSSSMVSKKRGKIQTHHTLLPGNEGIVLANHPYITIPIREPLITVRTELPRNDGDPFGVVSPRGRNTNRPSVRKNPIVSHFSSGGDPKSCLDARLIPGREKGDGPKKRTR